MDRRTLDVSREAIFIFLIREVSSNLRGGYDTTETTYSFTDRPSHSTHTHTAQNAPTLTEAYDYTYDHADRLTKVEHTFGGVKRTLLAHTYDELCRLSHTDYHGSSANRLTYSYNTRGWLTAISGSKFTYDGLNRMLDAVYGEEIYIYEFERTLLNVSGVISR